MEKIKSKAGILLSSLIIEGFLLYGVLSTVCETTWPVTEPYWRWLLNMLYLLVLVNVLLKKNSWIDLALMAGFLGLTEITRITTQTNAVLWFMGGIVTAKELDLNRVFRVDLATRAVLGCGLIVLPLLGLYPNYANVMLGERLRSSFGWAHPNEMGLFFLMMCLLWLYFRHDRWSWQDSVGMLLVIAFLDYFANSRTSEICILGIAALEGIVYFLKKKGLDELIRSRIWAVLCAAALGVGCAGTIFLVRIWSWDAAWAEKLPQTVWSRLMLAHSFWEEKGFSLLGQTAGSDTYLDIMYTYLGLNYGIVVLVLFLFLNLLAIWKAFRDQNEKMLLMLLVFLTYSVLEHEHFKLISGFYPILLGHALWPVVEETVRKIRSRAGRH